MKNTWRRFLSAAMAVVLVLSLAPVSVFAATSTNTNVSYIDANGVMKTTAETVNVIDEASDITDNTLTAGWYLVQGEITVDNHITTTGDVHLILADGAKLTANKGVRISDTGDSLTIYAQSSAEFTMGKLYANGCGVNEYRAGINVDEHRTLTINGGYIEARGFEGEFNAGAGIGSYGISGTIIINNGIVQAYEAGRVSSYSAAIGGGHYNGGGAQSWTKIEINGGVVTAHGGIGTGKSVATPTRPGSVTITGGVVKAEHIGNSRHDYLGDFSTNKPDGTPGTAIIIADVRNDDDKTNWSGIIIDEGEGAVYGNQTLTADLTVDGSFTIPAGTTLTIPEGKTLTLNGTATNSGTITGAGVIRLGTNGQLKGNKPQNTGGTVTPSGTLYGDFTVTGDDLTGVSYVGGALTINTDKPITISNTNPDTATTDSIVVDSGIEGGAKITLAGVHISTSADKAINAESDLNLTLAERSKNSVTATGYYKYGIYGTNITIDGSGELTASGGNNGIYGTAVTINSGTVTATGTTGGGIYGTTVTISGGTVNAAGYDGISGTTVTINSGTVNATGGRGGGIYGTTVTISGGTVEATASEGTGIYGNFSTDDADGNPGNAFIVASSIDDQSGKTGWSGVIFVGNEGEVYGSPTLNTAAEIPNGYFLLVPGGSTLTTNDKLTNNGTILNLGTVTGAVTGNQPISRPDDLTATYGQKLSSVTLPIVNGGAWSWENEETSVGDAGIKTFDAKFTPTGKEPITGIKLSVTVGKATPTPTPTENLTATYGQKLSSVTLPTGWAWDAPETDVGNAGSKTFPATFTPTDTNNYNKVQANLTVTVNPAQVTKPTADTNTFTYTGQEQTYTVALDDRYTVTGNKRTDAGSQTVTVSLKDNANYEWENGSTDDVTFTFTIGQKDISNAEITLGDALTYNGIEQTQTVAGVVIDDLTVTYDVSGNTATNVGTSNYTLTVTGTGNFKGTATKTWNINKAVPNAELFDFTAPQDLVYDSNAKAATVTAKPGVTGMGSVTVKYYDAQGDEASPVDVGTYTVKIDVAEGGNYKEQTGIAGTGWTFAITKSGSEVTPDTGSVTTVDYGGTLVLKVNVAAVSTFAVSTPAINTVDFYCGTTKLGTANVDYTSGVFGTATLNYDTKLGGVPAGTHEVKAYFGGSQNLDPDMEIEAISVTVNKIKAELSWSDLDAAALIYDGQANVLTATATGLEGDTLGVDLSLSGDNINVGSFTYTATELTGEKAGFYELPAEKSKTETITARPLTVIPNSGKTKVYGASDPELTYIFTGNVTGEEPGFTGALTHAGVDVGQYEITKGTLALADNDSFRDENYNLTVTAGVMFTITQATPVAVQTPAGSAITYEQTLSASTLPDGWAWADSTIVPAVTNNGYTAYYAIADDVNYDWSSVEGYNATNHRLERTVALSVSKKEVTVPTIASKVYNGQNQTADVPTSTYYSVTTNAGGTSVGKYDVVLTLNDANNYRWSNGAETAAITLQFEITKSGSAVSGNHATAIYGEKITLSVNVTLPSVSTFNLYPAENQVSFYCGETLLGTVDIVNGVATLEYDTKLGGIPTGSQQTITVYYGGSNDLNQAVGSLTATISPAQVTKPVADDTVFTYTGDEQTYTVAENTLYEVSGNKRTDAGSQTVTVSLKDKVNYTWTDGSTDDVTFTFTIEQKDISDAEVTLGDALTYNGNEQTQTVASVVIDKLAVTYDVSGNTATNVGTSDYTLTVTGTGNFKGTATKAWNISKATPILTITPSDTSLSGGGRVELTVTGAPAEGTYEITCDPTISANADGSYTLPNETEVYTFTVSYTESSNYTAATATCTVSVTKHTYIPPMPNYYTLTFDTNGGTTISSITRVFGTTIDLTGYTTTREGFTFTGWYADEWLTEEVTSVKLRKDTTVYAGWEKIEEPVVNPFKDVFESDWYYDDVMYVYEKDLMQGTATDMFSPAVTTTRGMIVTILYRLEGEPSTYGLDNPFTDLTQDWYVDAVKWAAANKIVEGYGNGKYGPEDPITREQMATILWRYAKYKGVDVSSGATMNITGYADDETISAYALPAMKWAVAEGIIGGYNGYLTPADSATRGQVAAILHRYCLLIEE